MRLRLLVALVLAFVRPSFSDEPTKPASRLSDRKAEELVVGVETIMRTAVEARKRGDTGPILRAAEEIRPFAREIVRRLLAGDQSFERKRNALLGLFTTLLENHMQFRMKTGGTLAEHVELRGELTDVLAARFGQDHWRTVEARVEHAAKRDELALGDERNRLYAVGIGEAVARKARGDFTGALGIWKKSLAVQTELFGEKHSSLASTHDSIGMLHHELGNNEESLRAHVRSLEIRRVEWGERHPKTLNTLVRIALVHDHGGRHDVAVKLHEFVLAERRKQLGENDPATGQAYLYLGRAYGRMGRATRAIELVEKSLAVYEKTKGPDDPGTAVAQEALGALLRDEGNLAAAEKHLRAAYEINVAARGADHHQTAQAGIPLANLLQRAGRFEEAAELLEAAVRAKRSQLGEHPHLAWALAELGELQIVRGQLVEAKSTLSESLRIRGKFPKDSPRETAMLELSLGNLAARTGDDSSALEHFTKARTTLVRLFGAKHPDAIDATNSLAVHLGRVGRHREARDLHREVANARSESLGLGDLRTATAFSNLGIEQSVLGEHEKARRAFDLALRTALDTVGERHLTTAAILRGYAVELMQSGNLEKALEFDRRVLAIKSDLLGDDHPETAGQVHVLATGERLIGRVDEAERMVETSLLAQRRHLDRTASIQSRQQQLALAATMRRTLDTYVSLALDRDRPGEEFYPAVSSWKGAVLGRRAGFRGDEDNEDERAKWDELERVTRELASRLGDTGPGDTDRLRELTRRRRELEADLAALNADPDAQTASTLERVRSAFDEEEGVLVDFLVYRYTGGAKAERPNGDRLAAFVVDSEGHVAFRDLGPLEPIVEAVDAWRAAVTDDVTPVPIAAARERTAGAELTKLVWSPIARDLKDAELVVVSPDGPLCRVTFAALPRPDGKEGFLVEDHAFALAPVPTRLALPASPVAAEDAPSLLLVGDVDYGRGRRPLYDALPGTKREIGDVRRLFATHVEGNVRTLTGTSASKSRFRTEAPRFGWVHVASHGFFTPPEVHSALADVYRRIDPARAETSRLLVGQHPDALSGLVFAGANLSEANGILSAMEVSAMDLHGVECVVLSACETGLGKVAGGEGALGLQRSLHAAGAKTTVATLWPIPDDASALLVARFYENLWDRELPRAQALREAQVWLMGEGRKRLPRDRREEAEGRLRPHMWGGYVLSGDWR